MTIRIKKIHRRYYILELNKKDSKCTRLLKKNKTKIDKKFKKL